MPRARDQRSDVLRRELGRWTQAVFALGARRVSAADGDAQARRLVANAKRVRRLHTEDGLAVRGEARKKIARRGRGPALGAVGPNERWSMDFVAARPLAGRWFRVLAVVVDQFTREGAPPLADSSLTGQKAALALSRVVAKRGAPIPIPVDNRAEFASKAMEAWAYRHGAQRNFIRPGPGRWKTATSNHSTEGRVTSALTSRCSSHSPTCVTSSRSGDRTTTRHARMASCAIAHRRRSRRNGRKPRRAARNPFRAARESPQPAIHWSRSLESVECKKRRPDRP